MTNTTTRNRTLVIVIAILLIANIGTLSYLLLNRHKDRRDERPDKRALIHSFLESQVKFSKEQLGRYEALSEQRRTDMKPATDDLALRREGLLKDLAAEGFTDSAIVIAAENMVTQQKPFEISMLKHFRDVRAICEPGQLKAFDSGFYKIIVKRGNGNRDRKK